MKNRKKFKVLLGGGILSIAILLAAQFSFLIFHTPRQPFERVIGFSPPESAKLMSTKVDGNHFDGQVEWLYELPSEIDNRWSPPKGFHKCKNEGESSKYAEVLFSFEQGHPELKTSGPFQIWVGGLDGNAYIAMDAVGRLTWFYFFWT